ncbi:MAG TPA: STELLO glycosyltransferase family protein [Bacteroidia bacterium]|nr:STELLO glycosyltransferase family protein [Bacteroidia bacterium]
MTTKKTLIITSIADDKHPILKQFATECKERNFDYIVIGDTKSPAEFNLQGCDFWSVERQLTLPFELAKITPTRHYSRKNLGYLLAIKNGSTELVETDDDNIPRAEFWTEKNREVKSHAFENAGWVNVYHYFTKNMIWPRGFPLEELQNKQIELSTLKNTSVNCPIQQGLADENPDVDAVYRLTYPLPMNFEIKNRLALGKNAWSPFNSQNTYWFIEAFPLMYLPSFCSFRMTDIWRSYVAQRIAWECGWSVLYHEPTVWQERNAHNLMKDFEDEIPGYSNNFNICKELQALALKPGQENICENLITCYQKLIDINVIGKEEMGLLKVWISDIGKLVK